MNDIFSAFTAKTPQGEMSPPPNTANRAGDNVPEYSVSEISNALKRTVEQTYNFVRVRGEVSGFKCPSSGHWYFSLKDDTSVLSAVCWRGVTSRMPTVPEDGMEVIVTGKLTTYGGRSSYQIVIDSLEPAGEGALLKLLEDRKKKLSAEGLFEQSRKMPIPVLPAIVGVITSPTGAVIRDILHRIDDRFPRPVLMWGVAVQGHGAAEQIAAAIDGFNQLPKQDAKRDAKRDNSSEGHTPVRPDVLIVARGGGSLEDLWAFNEECVVRAVAQSTIPIISAVGHETDTTLIDFVADRRAPTPTAAAEMAVPVRMELLHRVDELHYRGHSQMQKWLGDKHNHVENLFRALPDATSILGHAEQRMDDMWERLTMTGRTVIGTLEHRLQNYALQLKSPQDIVDKMHQSLQSYGERLHLSHGQNMVRINDRLASLSSLLESYSYRNVLKRGFTVIRDDTGQVIQSAHTMENGTSGTVEFYDGHRTATFANEPTQAKVQKSKDPKIAKSKSADKDEQGSLFE